MSIPRYEKCLVWPTEGSCQWVKEKAMSRDGVDLEIDGPTMFFPDKFTFDHIVYHYSVKAVTKPQVKLVSEL